MDQHLLDLALDLDSAPAPNLESNPANLIHREPSTPATRLTPTLTNSPGCAPAPALALRSTDRPPLRRVRTDAWSVPASASWARPSRALRKVARRAVDEDRGEPA